MKKKTIPQFLIIGLCGIMLIGCSNNDEPTGTSSSTTESEEVESTDTTNSESSSAVSETSSEETASSSTDQESQETPSNEPNDISSEFKMIPELVLLPTTFPTTEPSSVTANLITNEGDNYTVSYTDVQGELAEVTGTVYENPASASEELGTFLNGKSVEPHEEGSSDLGYGITGYGEGAAGTQQFSWQEGNWLFSIRSVSEDQMDNPGIAKKIVAYLEEHYLPAPKDQGIVYIQYPQGGEEVNVDIRWQKNNIIYQLKTTRVPLDALEMVFSMNRS
ncbi:MAG: hypothetical protein ABS916_09085 [Carnobacterium sp.]|uniref:hypothetical protein n=1 Tax=Carnobacterium sp. TaxID=48221 RepID=UPI003314A3E5